MDTQLREKRVSVSLYGGGDFHLSGVSAKDSEILEGAFRAGHHWVRAVDGKLESCASFRPLPKPADDPLMQAHWPQADTLPSQETLVKEPVQLKLFDLTPERELGAYCSPSFQIQGLCAYEYTPERYKEEALKLESWGFNCLRSRREGNGRYWEIWYLGGSYAAIGALGSVIKRSGFKDERQKTQLIIDFLKRYGSFGSLDVSIQRLATVLE